MSSEDRPSTGPSAGEAARRIASGRGSERQHHRRASSGLGLIDPGVQANEPVPILAPDALGQRLRVQPPVRSHSDTFYGNLNEARPTFSLGGAIDGVTEENLQRLSDNPLRFLSLPHERDAADDEVRIPGASGAGSVPQQSAVPPSPHTTASYRQRQVSRGNTLDSSKGDAQASVPVSRTASSSILSQRHTPRSGYGTIPDTPRSILSSRIDNGSAERSGLPRTAHPTLGHAIGPTGHSLGFATHGTGRALTDGYLTRRPSALNLQPQDDGLRPQAGHVRGLSTPAKLTGLFNSMRRKGSSSGLKSVRSYDGDMLQSGAGGINGDISPSTGENQPTANGIRVWYSSYVTIDWLHDQIKDSLRRGRIRRGGSGRSLRGIASSVADRLAGWIVVTLVGVITAFIAYCIIKTESTLFDLKEGYCAESWIQPKKHCCRKALQGECRGWVTWKSMLEHTTYGPTWISKEFAMYFLVALCLAIISSTMTVYLTSSANHEPKMVPATHAHSGGDADPFKTPNEDTPLAPGPPPLKKKIMYFAAGSGIPEVKTILSGFVIHGYLGISTLFVKSVGLALSVASGLSLGKEGPVVHIAAAVGNIICRQFPKFERNEGKKREILSAACASGVAVAFGAPIGGVLFSLEEVSYYFPPKVMWRSFFSAAVATLTLRALNPYGNGRLVLLETHYLGDHHSNAIYAVAILLGVFGGLYGAYFAKLNILWSKRVRQGTWLARHPIIEVAMVVSITTLLSYPLRWAKMGGVEYVAQLFGECSETSRSRLCDPNPAVAWAVVRELTAAMCLRAGLTVITFGIKLPAGIFIPSLAAGAAFGRIFGISMQQLLPHQAANITPGIWALIGAAATLAGVTRTTVSLVVIILELTGDMGYTVPTAISVLVAKAVADAIEQEGIYDLVIQMNQFPYLNAKKQHTFGHHSVADVLDSVLPVLQVDESHTVSRLRGKVEDLLALGNIDGSLPCCFTYEVDDELSLGVLGLISVNDLKHAMELLTDQPEALCNLLPKNSDMDARATRTSIYSFQSSEHEDPYDLVPFIDQAPLCITIDSPLELVQQLFVRMGARTIVVTDRRGRYCGLILKKRWLRFLEELDAEME